MNRHYLSRAMRNAPVSVALCGYRFTPEELDWSQKRLPYSFFPSLVSCGDCYDIMSSLVPQKHWAQRVEIYRLPGCPEWRYTAFYPDRLIKGDSVGQELTVFDPEPYNPEPPGPADKRELPYLEFQNVYDIMKLLAQSTETAWRQPTLCCRPETAAILHQAAKRLERTAANEENPEHRAKFQATAQQLQSLHAGIKNGDSHAFIQAQAEAFDAAWHDLEAIRYDKALSLRDALAPFIDDHESAPTAPQEPHAAAR